MSMLSAQCDELRDLALWLDDEFYDTEATKVREAADTIWELRCRLVDAEDRVRKSGELCKLCERESENAKLRELVRDLWLTGSLCDAIPDMRLQAKGGDWRTMQERVDEALGIEVDDD